MGARADDHDAIETIGNDARVEAKRLAQEALRAIALHGAADLAGRDDTQPRGCPETLTPCPLSLKGEGVTCLNRFVLTPTPFLFTPSPFRESGQGVRARGRGDPDREQK